MKNWVGIKEIKHIDEKGRREDGKGNAETKDNARRRVINNTSDSFMG